MKLTGIIVAAAVTLASATWGAAQAQDLPSWNEGPARQAILEFVDAATTEGGPDWIAPADRIAVFDSDGTLWSEQPAYFHLFYIADRVKEIAPRHPEWHLQQPFKGVLDGDLAAVAATGERGLMQLLAVSHAWITDEGFRTLVETWLAEARHPTTGRPYTSMIYQPMVELQDYLRAHGFQTWIVSGSGTDFMRPWVEQAYGIPANQVIGSEVAKDYQVIEGKPQLVRGTEILFVNDGPNKPVSIDRHIRQRPVMAIGNSDGDYEMLEYVTGGDGPRLGMIVHHTDGDREFAYDRESDFGRLDKARTDALAKGWVLIDMARDWSTVYPPEP